MELKGIDKYARYTSRLWILLVLALLVGSFLNFFDFFIIGFINTFISKPWHINVGDATWLILASGIGLVVGGFGAGKLMDAYGRKIILIIMVVVYSFFSILSGAVPTGNWQLLAFYRFFIGLGDIVRPTPISRARTMVPTIFPSAPNPYPEPQPLPLTSCGQASEPTTVNTGQFASRKK